MGFSFTKREIRLQSGILHYKMGFLLYKRDFRVAIHLALVYLINIFLNYTAKSTEMQCFSLYIQTFLILKLK